MRKKITIFGILSIIYIIVFPFVKEYVMDAPYKLVIEIEGEKNENSKGTEIWINSISRDGEFLDLNNVFLGEGWEIRERIFNTGEKCTSWKIYIRSKQETVITFVKHPYSGIVKITDPEGKTEIIDLYSPEEVIYEYSYTVTTKK